MSHQGLTVAPYGEIMTVTLDKQIEKAKEEQLVMSVNDAEETIKLDSLRIRGVDTLSTEDIGRYLNAYLNGEEVSREGGEKLEFKVYWINDSCANIVFSEKDECLEALKLLSMSSNQLTFDISENVQERESKPFKAIFKDPSKISKTNDESEAIEIERLEQDNMVDDTIELYIRQSFFSDRKVKNANTYSRYYLLHGEPERRPERKQGRRSSHRSREPLRRGRRYRDDDDDEDLFAGKFGSRLSTNNNRSATIPDIGGERWKSDMYREEEPAKNRDDEDDLFPDFKPKSSNGGRGRDRSRSPVANRNRSLSPDLMEDVNKSIFDRIGQVNNRRRAHDLFQ